MRIPLATPVFLLASLFLLSCNTKTTEERIRERTDKETCKELLNEVLSEYMTIEWDSISFQVVQPENILAPMLTVDGYGRSNSYANEQFHVNSTWLLDETGEKHEFSSLNVSHKELGRIAFISGRNADNNSIVDSTTFKERLFEIQKKKQEKAREHANYVQLAYKNKTKVHFGITRDEYYQLGKEYQRDFYDGLIGKGASEYAKPFFVKDKFVGFEINDYHSKASHGNIYTYAKEVRNRYYKGIRYDMSTSCYVSDIYNLEVQERLSNVDGNSVIIKAYWNAYSRLYAK